MAIDHEARAKARARVSDELVRVSMSPTELARKAGVDSDTVSDFLNGKRWPQPARRHMIATALGWVAEGIDQAARGEEPGLARGNAHADLGGVTATIGGNVRPGSQDAGVLLDMPPEALEGLGPAEREEVITAAKLSALAKAREIRRRLDE